MAKPNVLCRLFRGKLIDTFVGFCDTFNYIVDFVENLKGDGDLDAAKCLKVDRSVPDRPVIRFSGSLASGGTTIKLIGTDNSYAMIGDPSSAEYKTMTFASAEDANVEVSVQGDDNGNATATVGVYYL